VHTVHHPHAALLRELVDALADAGFDVRHYGDNAMGGICLTPTTEGVTINWALYNRLPQNHPRANIVHEEVQQTMNYALADVVVALGFEIDGFAQDSSHVVKIRSCHH
jgi:hypothetical protein